MSSENNIIAFPSDSKLFYALKYASIGWHVFPLFWIQEDGKCSCGNPECDKNAGKHPLNRLVPFGQSQASTDTETIKRWWTREPDANIGVHLAKSNKCAIDVDPRNGGDYTMEQLEAKYGRIQSDVMAFTGGGGEHHVYELPNYMISLPGKIGKGIDVKLNGYIVVEPSNHQSGKHYVWEGSSNPLEGAIAPPLPDWLRDLGQITLEPSGYEPPPEIEPTAQELADLNKALPFIDSDDRDVWLRVGMALHNFAGSAAWELWCNWSMTSRKFNLLDQTRVWRSFRRKGIEGITLSTIFRYAMDSGWNNTGPDIKTESGIIFKPDKVNESYSTGDIDINQFPVPILNEICEWMETYSDRPTRSITMQGVIALISVLAGRNYISDNQNDSSLYLMLLADTGKGKGYAPKAITILLQKAGLSRLLSGAGCTSEAGVFSALYDAPRHIQIIDEFGKYLQEAKKQKNGMMTAAFDVLTKSYSYTNTVLHPKNKSRHGVPRSQRISMDELIVMHPSITLYGFATPGQVFDNLHTSQIEDGFLNRFISVISDEPKQPRRKWLFSEAPTHIIDWAKLINNMDVGLRPGNGNVGHMETAYNITPNPVRVSIPDEVMAVFDALMDEIDSYTDDKEKLAKRWYENSMRLATGLAVAENSLEPEITLRIAEWAIAYVRYHGERWITACSLNIADNDVHRLRNQLLGAIEKQGKYGLPEHRVHHHCRLWSCVTQRQRDDIIKSLIQDGKIVRAIPENKLGRKATKPVYYSTEFVEMDE